MCVSIIQQPSRSLKQSKEPKSLPFLPGFLLLFLVLNLKNEIVWLCDCNLILMTVGSCSPLNRLNQIKALGLVPKENDRCSLLLLCFPPLLPPVPLPSPPPPPLVMYVIFPLPKKMSNTLLLSASKGISAALQKYMHLPASVDMFNITLCSGLVVFILPRKNTQCIFTVFSCCDFHYSECLCTLIAHFICANIPTEKQESSVHTVSACCLKAQLKIILYKISIFLTYLPGQFLFVAVFCYTHFSPGDIFEGMYECTHFFFVDYHPQV